MYHIIIYIFFIHIKLLYVPIIVIVECSIRALLCVCVCFENNVVKSNTRVHKYTEYVALRLNDHGIENFHVTNRTQIIIIFLRCDTTTAAVATMPLRSVYSAAKTYSISCLAISMRHFGIL